ncbi:54S ribosomal protein L41, mitochondrial [[Candida] anglica]|uniref:Large ribosomal subunit protein uL23m n=1 Tax=[Candida] anglica TaxID=148631 RepID=A0ABP0EEG6_9ASCO
MSFWNVVRFAHFKSVKKYPKINVSDVVLSKPKVSKRQERQPLLSQSVKDTLFPAEEIAKLYKANNKPVPRKFDNKSEEISRRNFELSQEAFSTGQPHFRVGEKQIYFPKARVVLLRPNAKHTPYQAKFLVPRNFNRMDLRDYLWNVYGLRALNVTVQLLYRGWRRGNNDYARYRGPQFKKMTIDMEDPFVWPELPQGMIEKNREVRNAHLKAVEHNFSTGSDKNKPLEVFDGVFNKMSLPNSFISKSARTKGSKDLEAYKKESSKIDDKNLVSQYLNL